MLPNKGDTVELISMENDPNPLSPGDKGVVYMINPIGNNEVQIGVEWESGRKLFLLYPEDKFKIIKTAE